MRGIRCSGRTCKPDCLRRCTIRMPAACCYRVSFGGGQGQIRARALLITPFRTRVHDTMQVNSQLAGSIPSPWTGLLSAANIAKRQTAAWEWERLGRSLVEALRCEGETGLASDGGWPWSPRFHSYLVVDLSINCPGRREDHRLGNELPEFGVDWFFNWCETTI